MICLCMIVQDEAHCLGETLRSALPYIDRWVIVDTGSTDGTQALIRCVLRNVPGELHTREFVDYATTRNQCLRIAGKRSPFVLMLDADDVLEDARSLRTLLACAPGGCFSLLQRWPDGDVWAAKILRTGQGWRYEGAVHEVPVLGEQRATRLIGPTIRHHPSEIGAARSRARWPRDVEVLEEALRVNPHNERARHYLEVTRRAIAGSRPSEEATP